MKETYPLTIFRDNLPVAIRNEQEWNDFAREYTLIHAAGGIVTDANNEILMIHRLGFWDFPKGKVEAGEEWEAAAVREVQEETGLHNITLGEALPNTYHTYNLRGTPILKITHWYAMRAPQQPLTPQTEEDISQAAWVPRTEISGHLQDSYPSLQSLWHTINQSL